LLGENNSNLTNKERRKDNNKAPETTKAKADPPQPRISKTSESTPPKVQAQEVGASQQPKKKNAPKEKPTDDNDNSTPPRDKKEIPMNIVLLYADDWTYKTLGKVNPFVKTPNLDKLADKGILFTHNCVTTSVCWMSRATLFTGQYASTHHAFKPSKGPFFETWNETLWQQLANAGYYNGFFGKWHNGMARRDLINQAMHENKFYFGRHWQTKSKHVTVKNYEDGVDFLLKKKWGDRPFSLTVSFYATHAMDTSKEHYYPQPKSMSLYANDTVPVNGNHTESWKRMPYFFGEKNEGRKRFRDRYKTAALYQTKMKNMYRMATEVDTACGKIIEELERQDLLKNTMIIFTTDNGNFHSEHGLADKWFPHEESIRVPLIVWDPRMPSSKAGTTNDEFTLNLDLAPTILSVS
jgi:arylsulfatase